MTQRPLLCLDHVLAYTGAATIDGAVSGYRAAGFSTLAQTVRHAPGLRNGFVGLGPEYLELLWVEDEQVFAAAGPWRQAQRRARRPFAFALRADDLESVRAAWRERGLEVGPLTNGAPADTAGGAPAWSFLHLPRGLLPGAACFVVRYHAVDSAARGRVRAAPNGIFALGGVSFVVAEPEVVAPRWRDLLAPGHPLDVERGERRLALGAHTLTWRTPEAFARRYAPFAPSAQLSELGGEIALVHLWSDDLDLSEDAFRRGGRAPRRTAGLDGPELFVPPDPRDGFAFAIAARPIADWVSWRCELTGEPISLAGEDRA